MGSAGRLLVVVAALWTQCGAQDLCDSVLCELSARPLCARSSEDGSLALFANHCVLRCTNCRLGAASVGVEYTLLNDTDECGEEAVAINECPEEMSVNEDGKLIDEIGLIQMDTDNYDSGEVGDVPEFAEDGLPFPLMPSFPDGLLGRLLDSAMAMPSPPQARDGSLTFVDADVKVSVNIHINPTPRPGPPPPPPPPLLEVVPPPPERLEYWVPVEGPVSTGPSGPRAAVWLVAGVGVLLLAGLHV